MTRKSLNNAIAEVIHQHRLDGFTSGELAFAILDKVEPLIRADERERQGAVFLDASGIGNVLAASVRQAVINDLRAKVEAREQQARGMVTHPDSYDTGPLWLATADAYADVLALFDGSN